MTNADASNTPLRRPALSRIPVNPSPRSKGQGDMLVIIPQIRAGRSLAGWNQHRLAQEASVAISTIRRIENKSGPLTANLKTIRKIRDALEQAGVEFVGDPVPGVLLHVDNDRKAEPPCPGGASITRVATALPRL